MSLIDRSINEDEENIVRSESSSGGSSPSDLRERLQHHPSPNEAARLANRVISISRRLSRKRDYYFHGTTNRIEENIEREEREERETVYSKKSYSDLKSKDARTRRRAKIRLENERNRTMVVSKPNEICPPDLKNDSNNDQRSGRNSLLDSKMEGIKEESSEQQASFGIDVLTSDPQRYSPLSSRLASTSGLYRNQQDEGSNDSSRSRGSASFLHLYSSASCENSPKNRIELQPLSPISIKNSLQNKYRPCRGVILQNLSSGSEAESGFEVMSDRIGMKKLDRLIPITPQETEISSHLCGSPKIQNINNSPLSIPLSTRKSSNYVLVKSSRNDYMENIVASPISGMNYIENKFQPQSLNEPPAFALNTRKNLSRDRSFYRALDTSRSDCSQDMRNSGVGKSMVDEPLFFSAREETIRDYNRERFETKPLRETSFYPISPRVPPNLETSRNVMPYDVINVVEQNFAVDAAMKKNCDIVFGDETEIPMNQYDPTNSNPCANQIFALTPRAIRSPEIILKSPITYKNPLDADKSEFYPSNITNTIALKKAISKRILNYESSNENKNSQLQNIMLPPDFKICGSSEIQSRTSSFTEFFAGDSTKSRENIFSPEFMRSNEETRALDEDKINSDQEFVNVPTLALNSQEVSFSTSPASKICSERHLDTDTLIMALSNASLDQKPTKDVSENTCSESCPDSKTISRPDSSDNLQMDTNVESRLKSDESHTKLIITSRTSCRSSFLSLRSKIPVKIPTDRSRMSLTSKYSESEKRTFSQRTNLNDSSRQTFGSNTSSPEAYRYESERSNETCKSRDSSPYAKSYEDVRNSGEVSYRCANTMDTMEQEKYSDSNYAKGEKEKGRLENVEKSSLTLEVVPSKTCLSLPCEVNKENKEGKEGDQSGFVKSAVNRAMRSDGFRSTDSAENSRKSEKEGKSKCVENVISSNDDSDSSSSRDYGVQKSVKGIEMYEESCNFISSRIAPSDSSTSRRSKHVNVYEGEIFEKIVENRKPPNLFENQIGDGGHEIHSMEDPDKLKYESLNASPDDEEVIKTEISIERENYKPQRFSLERLAAEQFRRTMNLEQTKIIQSDTATFFPTDKFCEMPQFILSCSSSTPKLRHDKSKESPRFKKKSQDRFPFTISEKTSIASMKFKVSGRLGNLDENAENKGYTLDMHPSITRLAGSGFEDSPTEIISYVAQTELENRYGKSSGMKGLVKKFSARWKKQKKCEEEEADGKTTSIIYKNRDYREERESSMESCSELSSLQEFKIYESMEEKLCKPEPNPDSPDEKSSVIRDDHHSFMGECSKNVSTCIENPCRRYDRDDLWVQDLKDSNSNREEQRKNEETSKKMDGTKAKNPYSVFFVKSTQVTPQTSARPFVSESAKKKQNILVQKKMNRVKFHNSSLVIVPKRSNENMHEKSKNRNSERNKKNKDMESGCFCLRFYRMIIPGSFGSISKYRSKANDNSPSIKKRFSVSLQRKKG